MGNGLQVRGAIKRRETQKRVDCRSAYCAVLDIKYELTHNIIDMQGERSRGSSEFLGEIKGRIRDIMKKPIIRALALATVAVLLIVTRPSSLCYADEADEKIANLKQQEVQTQQTISDLEKQTKATKDSIALLEEQRKVTESNVSELKDQQNELQAEINGYSAKLDDLNGQIVQAQEAMSGVSSQIVELNDQLTALATEKANRELLLKKRLKSVYERGGSRGMLQNILEAGSFKNALNRYVYLDAMVTYDRQKISECAQLEAELDAKLKEVEEKEAQINAYQSELDGKYSEIESISEEVRGKLSDTNSSLSAENDKLNDYDNQLAALDKTMKSLESQTAAAQAALAKQIAQRLALKKEDTSGSYSASASELEWLAATIQAEADGESYTGKLAVGSVIMNRVKSSAFPNSIKGVITQNMQFASYRSGKVELIISKGPNSTCVKAAQEVIGGARVGDYLFFMTKYYADYYGIREYTMIGNHAFFYRWDTYSKPSPAGSDTQEATPTPTPAASDSQEAAPTPTPTPTPTPKQPEEGTEEETDDGQGGEDGGGSDDSEVEVEVDEE